MRIDAHQHFWRIADRAGQWPPPELAAIHRDFTPEDMRPLLADAGVDGTVLVQTMENEADTAFMLDLADRTPFILGVVGWTDMKASDAPAKITRLARHPKLKGFRPMLQDISDDRWIDDPRLDPAVVAMIEQGLVFDALVLPRHLEPLLAFARRYPNLPIVIDHGAKPPIVEGRIIGWHVHMKALAELPHVHCKLSGLLTEAGDQRPQAVRPYAETILDLFGSERVIWGSDWPVLRLAGEYGTWLDQCLDIVPAEHHAAVFGGNANRFYRLGV
ncbi:MULTISPECIES: amidohydrolase family protein [Rhizobium/Agrobacterium group]|uniref:Amidohydrolase family protein n=2 Tax=Neorhizobium TaxID=1525371 RepID=A0ABV0LX14_9HYPH|nr:MULTISPECIES: amidohydrolase family protein [Rhizobium/Agrobacterium group]KGD86354.1 amidohydrolase [Rhizobium sp. YS-1r]MCC2608457.1 amidohydrolase family protein [Neorhizobium petrolearium]WGI68731.1 amidohydrolase family protein [Neorhizobium petrolearium]